MDKMELDLVPMNEVYYDDKRNTKKTLLPTDGICVKCGIIFNAYYNRDCVICEGSGGGRANEEIIKIVKEGSGGKENVCDHKEFIFGKQSVSLRILLDYGIEDLRGLCEVHGCAEGSRGKMVIGIMKKLHNPLDKRINEELIRKMIKRNSRKFRFWKNIEDAIHRAKKPDITLVSADDCIEITEIDLEGLSQHPALEGGACN